MTNPQTPVSCFVCGVRLTDAEQAAHAAHNPLGYWACEECEDRTHQIIETTRQLQAAQDPEALLRNAVLEALRQGLDWHDETE